MRRMTPNNRNKQSTISKSLHCHNRPLVSPLIHCTPPQKFTSLLPFYRTTEPRHWSQSNDIVSAFRRKRPIVPISSKFAKKPGPGGEGGGEGHASDWPRSRATQHEGTNTMLSSHGGQSASTDDSFGSVHARAEARCRSTDSARQPSPTTEARIGEERPSQSSSAGGVANGIFAVPFSISIGRNREAVDNEPSCVHPPPHHRASRAPLPRFKFSVLVRLARSPSRVLLVSPFFPGTSQPPREFLLGTGGHRSLFLEMFFDSWYEGRVLFFFFSFLLSSFFFFFPSLSG